MYGRRGRERNRAGRRRIIETAAVTPRSPKAPVPRLALTVTEVPAALGVSADYFTEHIRPELRCVVRGSKRLYPVAEIERWLAAAAGQSIEGDSSR